MTASCMPASPSGSQPLSSHESAKQKPSNSAALSLGSAVALRWTWIEAGAVATLLVLGGYLRLSAWVHFETEGLLYYFGMVEGVLERAADFARGDYILDEAYGTVYPPGASAFYAIGIQLFGYSTAALRLFTLVISIVELMVAYLCVRRFFGRSVAITFLFCFSLYLEFVTAPMMLLYDFTPVPLLLFSALWIVGISWEKLSTHSPSRWPVFALGLAGTFVGLAGMLRKDFFLFAYALAGAGMLLSLGLALRSLSANPNFDLKGIRGFGHLLLELVKKGSLRSLPILLGAYLICLPLNLANYARTGNYYHIANMQAFSTVFLKSGLTRQTAYLDSTTGKPQLAPRGGGLLFDSHKYFIHGSNDALGYNWNSKITASSKHGRRIFLDDPLWYFTLSTLAFEQEAVRPYGKKDVLQSMMGRPGTSAIGSWRNYIVEQFHWVLRELHERFDRWTLFGLAWFGALLIPWLPGHRAVRLCISFAVLGISLAYFLLLPTDRYWIGWFPWFFLAGSLGTVGLARTLLKSLFAKVTAKNKALAADQNSPAAELEKFGLGNFALGKRLAAAQWPALSCGFALVLILPVLGLAQSYHARTDDITRFAPSLSPDGRLLASIEMRFGDGKYQFIVEDLETQQRTILGTDRDIWLDTAWTAEGPLGLTSLTQVDQQLRWHLPGQDEKPSVLAAFSSLTTSDYANYRMQRGFMPTLPPRHGHTSWTENPSGRPQCWDPDLNSWLISKNSNPDRPQERWLFAVESTAVATTAVAPTAVAPTAVAPSAVAPTAVAPTANEALPTQPKISWDQITATAAAQTQTPALWSLGDHGHNLIAIGDGIYWHIRYHSKSKTWQVRRRAEGVEVTICEDSRRIAQLAVAADESCFAIALCPGPEFQAFYNFIQIEVGRRQGSTLEYERKALGTQDQKAGN